jgi:hypothetical protein
MGLSYRIRTDIGINKSIDIQLDQDFENLEILSLSLQQTDVFPQSCADYGVIVGRVTANNGLGLPNARVSIFIPVDSVDETDPVISSIYSYKTVEDRNEDGYRYNLLPYEKSYSRHAATGTFPSRNDVLTNKNVIEIYDKYYKYTTRTNDSGDYMIVGVPIGEQTIFMDVDLSDIGEFSLTPQDLIRMGLATEEQVAGNKFKTSTDLNSLPQIISLTKSLEVSPFWGDPDFCQVSINRVDFDLRNEANIEIQPTSVFMGGVYSSPDSTRIRGPIDFAGINLGQGCKPKDNLGNLCGLFGNPGQILAIRQTLAQDTDGNPILEQYELEKSGNVIDGDGTWLTEIPMNLDYITTNEFGERILSNDPEIGVPTKAKYRFKIKWQQPASLTTQTRRANFLVPNVRENGWTNSLTDPYTSNTAPQTKDKLKSSYYFGLDWSGYTKGFTTSETTERLNEIINCEDTFYEFKYNRVYTVSGLIDQYKRGGRGRFIGIKEIDSNDCEDSVNKFPVNEGFKNFDLLYFVVSILLQILQYFGIGLLIIAHIILSIYSLFINSICLICKIPIFGTRPFQFICNRLGIDCKSSKFTIKLPMITYPSCQACDCGKTKLITDTTSLNAQGVLSYVSLPSSYYNGFEEIFQNDKRTVAGFLTVGTEPEDIQVKAISYSEAMGGNEDVSVFLYKTPKSQVRRFNSDELDEDKFFAYSDDLPLGLRINVFNTRNSYFENLNKIKVTFAQDLNLGKFHFDNTITVLSNTNYNSGTLLTTVDPLTSSDLNFTYTAETIDGTIRGITGTTQNLPTNISVKYAVTQTTEQTTLYSLPTGSTIDRQLYPMDREYFQVVTAITVSDAAKIWDDKKIETFGNVLKSPTKIKLRKKRNTFGYREIGVNSYSPYDVFENMEEQYILILQRGVDPYSPKYNNQYRLGALFGKNIDDPNWVVNTQTRVNIPIQKLVSSNKSVQNFNQNEMFYPSYYFQPGNNFSGFTTSTIGFYGIFDDQYRPNDIRIETINGVKSLVSRTVNDFYSSSPNASKYDNSEDISGSDYMFANINPFNVIFTYDTFTAAYYSNVYYTISKNNPVPISNKVRNVMRNDRLPSSDGLNAVSWDLNPPVLQQNNNFIFYEVTELEDELTIPGFDTGADIETQDVEGLPNAGILSTFDCDNMVDLDCYEGFGSNFRIKQSCVDKGKVEKGCYVFLRRPLIDLFRDTENFLEWGYRFRFFFALCRGVLSQTFTNNWINGSLYMFPIQVDTIYNSQNKPISKFCKQVIYFDEETNNFYYRSSPYNITTKRFVGKSSLDNTAANINNLLFPTTVMNLGMKDSFFNELILEPDTNSYTIRDLDSSSYGDTSDLVNLFVISRIIDDGILKQIFSVGNNGINQLFSRGDRKIDGDLAQLLSINSEVGVVKFSPEYYEILTGSTNNPVNILGTAKNPAIAVWFSSTTEDLQFKDYLTPGRLNFRSNNNQDYYPYLYGIKSQNVPFYQWKLNNTNTIFGDQRNNWATNTASIVTKKYQGLDRTSEAIPTYFQSTTSPSNTDLNKRGYIFSLNETGNYYEKGARTSQFLVGAPYQFYFGVVKGFSALNKFKEKYSVDE